MTSSVSMTIDNRTARVRFASDRGIQLLTAGVRRQLSEILEQLRHDKTCSVVVFEATGQTFIAGADIHELNGLTAETAEPFAREVQQLFQQVAELNAVTVAAIHASCAGGGCELALACDLRYAGESARIGLPETSLGILPGWGGTVRANRLLGPAVAARLILTGELLSAADARRLGLVDDVFPDAEFAVRVQEQVVRLQTRGPQACAIAKRLIAQLQAEEIEGQLIAEARAFAECYRTAEPGEGTRAFLEKRSPVWPASL